jgi:flagellar hook-length control protein FliK
MNTGLMDLMGTSSKVSINYNVENFSKMMQQKSYNESMLDDSYAQKIDSNKQPDSKMVTTNSKKIERPVEKETKVEEGKLQESISNAVEEIKNEIAKDLDISVEELEQAMEALGVTEISLLDATQLPLIFAQVNGEDMLNILTNEELSNDLNDLMQMVNEKVENLANGFGISKEEINEMLTLPEKTNELQNVDEQNANTLEKNKLDEKLFTEALEKIKGESKEENQEIQKDTKISMFKETKEASVEITNMDTTGNDAQNDKNGKAEANVNEGKSSETNVSVVQNFSQKIMENIEYAVNEITYTKESVDTEGIMKQIVNRVNVVISKDVTSMELQLHPESLGKLDLQVAMKDGRLVAEFKTENEAVKNVIEGQLIQLKETLEAQGLKVSSVEVSVAEQGLKQDMNQNSKNQKEFDEAKKSGVRKINLQGIRDLDDIELMQMNEEEQIATKMMLENGNTVDFTA